jgi:predicted TIM-barrel fold metal-dependent hydrolase
MYTGKLISSDDHVFEPRDLWTSRVPRAQQADVPHVVRETDGDWWVWKGHKLLSFGPGTQPGQRFEKWEDVKLIDREDRLLPGGYDPKRRLKDMEIEGMEAGILYTTVAIALWHFAPSDELTALLRPYNDWLAGFCAVAPSRFKGICLINTDDVPEAVKEMERCKKLGYAGALISTWPGDDRQYFLQEYEPLWASAQDLQMPLHLHLGGNRPGASNELQKPRGLTPSFKTNFDYWVRMSMADMILSGVFERYPRLLVGSVEQELAWIPHFIERMDYSYTQRAPIKSDYRFKEQMLPSGYFHRNCFASFQQDAIGIRLRELIGVQCMLWGSDYPHIESTFPRSRQILGDILADCTDAEKTAIAYGNAKRIYGI